MNRIAALLVALTFLVPAAANARGFGQQPRLEWDRPQWEAPIHRHEEEVDFDSLSLDEKRKIQRSLEVRRKMADAHQVLAFVASGLIVASEIIGIVNSTQLEHPGEDFKRADLEPSLGVHRTLATSAMVAYYGAGIVAWSMPPAVTMKRAGVTTDKKKGPDSGDVHAVLSIIHGIAMGTVIATGILQANVIPAGEAWGAVESTHAIAGFTASGTIIAAAIVIGTL